MKKSCFNLKCLFRVCFSAVDEDMVYELVTAENRAKLVLISGVFYHFISRNNNNLSPLRNSITSSYGEMAISTYPSPISSMYPYLGIQLKYLPSKMPTNTA